MRAGFRGAVSCDAARFSRAAREETEWLHTYVASLSSSQSSCGVFFVLLIIACPRFAGFRVDANAGGAGNGVDIAAASAACIAHALHNQPFTVPSLLLRLAAQQRLQLPYLEALPREGGQWPPLPLFKVFSTHFQSRQSKDQQHEPSYFRS